MVGKPHRQNSAFQLKFFLAGSCSTADGAYILMYGQLVDMRDKVKSADAQLKRRQAKLKSAEARHERAKYNLDLIKNNGEGSALLADVLQDEADMLEAEADKMEQENGVETWNMNLKAAQQELADIEAIMAELKPQCKYFDEDILIMSERAQEDEWLGELKKRAENFLLTAGTIPHDHFDTMRMHPRFKEELVPHITQLNTKVSGSSMESVMLGLEQPKLLLEV